MIIILQKPANNEDIEKARQDYKTYIKVTADITTEIVAIGGEYHFDAEQKLLDLACRQEDIWGGGIDLVSKKIDTNAMINIRPKQNEGTEIINDLIKQKFIGLVKKYLGNYVQ